MAARNGLERLGLRMAGKFVLAVTLLVLVVVALVVAVGVAWVRDTMVTQLETEGESLSRTIARTAGYYVIFDLKDDLTVIAADLSQQQNIAYAEFLSSDGSVVASTPGRQRPAQIEEIARGSEPTSGEIGSDTGDLHVFVQPIFETGAEEGGEPRGWFRLVMNESAADAAVRRFIIGGILVTIAMLGVAILLARLGARQIVGPVESVVGSARSLAAGDLTKRSEVATNDEIGELAIAFNEMASNLEQTVGQFAQSQARLSAVTQTIGSASHKVLESADSQRTLLDEAYTSIDQLNDGIKRVSRNVEDLSGSSEETSSSILEMVASMEEVSRHADSLLRSVEDTSSATTEMVSSINEVDQNVDYLRSFVTDTSASMIQMGASISQVQSNAARSYDLAVSAAEAAGEGMTAVRETIDGMERIRSSTTEASAVVTRLGDRSTEIGKILNVIEDVAEQTNLLALNAAILAAQAGEHGRGFSVVAGQIRDLSERTANSTRDISNLIRSVRDEVAHAIVKMNEGSVSVESGVRIAHDAGRALNRILESSNSAAEAGKEIANATRDQAQGSENVTRAVEKVQDMVNQINAATRQQTAGSQHILSSLESIREITRYVQQAMVEQRSGSQMISRAAERMIDKVHDILEASAGQAKGSQAIVGMMEQVRAIAEQNRRAANEMTGAIETLNGAMRGLDEQMRRFRARG